MTEATHIPYRIKSSSPEEMLHNVSAFFEEIKTRRSVREFSNEPVPAEIIRKAIEAAGTAPSGANMQPWTFCMISSSKVKEQIRAAAEKEEYENYHGRMNHQWMEDIKGFGTTYKKPFLTEAPYLIALFKKPFREEKNGLVQNYYVNESVGIATGFLLCALHKAGLATLTHAPSPMGFLAKILDRPQNERAFLLIAAGLPHPDARVPDIHKAALNKILVEY